MEESLRQKVQESYVEKPERRLLYVLEESGSCVFTDVNEDVGEEDVGEQDLRDIELEEEIDKDLE